MRAQAFDELVNEQKIFTTLANRLLDDIILMKLDEDNQSWNLVDLAGGTGLCTMLALSRNLNVSQVILVEPDDGLREIASNRFSEVECGPTFIVMDSEAEAFDGLLLEEFPNVEIDAIICSCSMHLIDERNSFASAARVLKPGGVFVFNLWWLCHEETCYLDDSEQWMALIKEALIEEGFDPRNFDWSPSSLPRARSQSGLRSAAEASGLRLASHEVDSDDVGLDFFIRFRAMDDFFLSSLTKEQKQVVIDKAVERGKSKTTRINTIRCCVLKPNSVDARKQLRLSRNTPPVRRYSAPVHEVGPRLLQYHDDDNSDIPTALAVSMSMSLEHDQLASVRVNTVKEVNELRILIDELQTALELSRQQAQGQASRDQSTKGFIEVDSSTTPRPSKQPPHSDIRTLTSENHQHHHHGTSSSATGPEEKYCTTCTVS